MEYCFTHICVPETAEHKRSGYLFGRYVKDGEPVQAECPGCGATTTDAIPMGRGYAKRNQNIIPDIGEYRSPIDGERITTRTQHRDHMKRHGVIEVGNEYPKGREPNNDPMPRAGHDIVRAMERR